MVSPKPFVIEYQLDLSDYRLLAEARRKTVKPKWATFYYYVFWPVLIAAVALGSGSFPVAVLFAVTALVFMWLKVKQTRRLANEAIYSEANYPLAFRQCKLNLVDQGIEVAAPAYQNLYRWNFIIGITDDKDFVHVMLTPMLQIHIPRRAFSSESQIEDLTREVNSRIFHLPK